MTKKDYEAIAKILKTRRDTSVMTTVAEIVLDLDSLFRNNPKYDSLKFFKACGY
jgi:hypothetical protein